MIRLLYVFCVLCAFNSYGMKSDDFFSIVSNYGTSKELHTKLSAISSKSKEADFFVQKFYEDKNPKENFSKEVIENVQRAADNIGKRYYEMAMKDCTDTELLQSALLFLNNEKPSGIDDRSESNSISSLISAARNLLMLRKNYNIALPPAIIIGVD